MLGDVNQPSLQEIQDARDALASARAATASSRAREAQSRNALEALSRVTRTESKQLFQAEREHTRDAQDLSATRGREQAAEQNLNNLIAGATSAAAVRPGMSADYPVVLFPVRIETRFQTELSPPELWIRVYPDELLALTHESELTEDEIKFAEDYWQSSWKNAIAAKQNGWTETKSWLEAQKDPWRKLVGHVPSARAAWLARQLEPEEFDLKNPPTKAEPQFPPVTQREHSWTRAAETTLLPDRFTVYLYRGGAQIYQQPFDNPVKEPLRLTANPETTGDDPLITLPNSGIRINQKARWTLDFDSAVEVGLGVRLKLTQQDLTLRFDRVMVLGLKETLGPLTGKAQIERLLDDHHYSRGLAFVPQGTSTKNTSRTSAGYDKGDLGGERSFEIERVGDLLTKKPEDAPKTNGQYFGEALGVDPAAVRFVDVTSGIERESARHMNNALWPATLGYFLEQMLDGVFNGEQRQAARRYFVNWVAGRGHYPAFRVGAVPYGILPVSSLDSWVVDANEADEVARALPDGLKSALQIWRAASNAAPRIGLSADADADLCHVLAMDAATREVWIRNATGPDYHGNITSLFGVDGDGLATQQKIELARQVAARLGHPEWAVRIMGMTFANAAHWMSYETNADPIGFDANGKPRGVPLVLDQMPPEQTDADYLEWILNAQLDELRDQNFPPDSVPPNALLYVLLRHAALIEYRARGLNAMVSAGAARPEEHYEPELIGIIPGTENAPTIWQRFNQQLPGTSQLLGDFIFQNRHVPEDTQLPSFFDSLQALKDLAADELQRLCAEEIDLCSHRLDAWITSLPARRLWQMRATKPLGSHLGAYSWVENLKPVDQSRVRQAQVGGQVVSVQANSGGYIHAPSMDHAATAAILRNAYLTRQGEAQERYAIDLSSAQVRTAIEILDAVRNGQPLWAVLGYRFERALQDRQLSQYIFDFRKLYPWVDPTHDTNGELPQGAEAIAARYVVHGVKLRDQWRNHKASLQGKPFDGSQLVLDTVSDLKTNHAARTKIESALDELDSSVDALADLLTAESVFQAVRGNTTATVASLDSMSRGLRPPEPELAAQPRDGIVLTHRVATLLGTPTLKAWPNHPTPRSIAEPALNGWAAELLGDPASMQCSVSFKAPQGGGSSVVSISELRLQAIDFVAWAAQKNTNDKDALSALDRLVIDGAFAKVRNLTEEPAALEIDYQPNGSTAMLDALEMARAIQDVLGNARPLMPRDLLALDAQVSETAMKQLTLEMENRLDQNNVTDTALKNFNSLTGDLANQLAAVQNAVDQFKAANNSGNLPDLAQLRKLLQDISLYGISSAFPVNWIGNSLANVEELLAQGQAVLIGAQRRLEIANDSKQDLKDRLQAVFGRDFVALPRFVFDQDNGASELEQALAFGPALVKEGSDPFVVRKWFQKAAIVRPALNTWKNLELMRCALASKQLDFEIAQLPYDKTESWVALPFQTPLKAARVSLALHRMVTPQPGDEWCGLLLDEWSEMVPNLTESTGVAFYYDNPGAEAPQAVLVAVPPDPNQTNWTTETLATIVNETLDLAKVRAVDGELLGDLGQFLPALCFAGNVANDTVATNFNQYTSASPAVRNQSGHQSGH